MKTINPHMVATYLFASGQRHMLQVDFTENLTDEEKKETITFFTGEMEGNNLSHIKFTQKTVSNRIKFANVDAVEIRFYDVDEDEE